MRHPKREELNLKNSMQNMNQYMDMMKAKKICKETKVQSGIMNGVGVN